jgi:hypothetical protein
LTIRKIAAHKLTDTALENLAGADPAELRAYRAEMEKFVGKSDQADDFDALIDYAGKVELSYGKDLGKPVEDFGWSKPVQKIDPDADYARDFRLRQENTRGTREYNEAFDVNGEKRDSRGRYIPKEVLREDADKIPQKSKTFADDVKAAKETGHDRGDGFTVDREFGVRSAGEAADIFAHEQAKATASSPEPSAPSADPGPVNF